MRYGVLVGFMQRTRDMECMSCIAAGTASLGARLRLAGGWTCVRCQGELGPCWCGAGCRWAVDE